MSFAVAPVPGTGAVADDSDLDTVWTVGMEYASGTYGGDADIEDLYIPVGLSFNFPKVSFDLTVPYLSVRAPSGTTTQAPAESRYPVLVISIRKAALVTSWSA